MCETMQVVCLFGLCLSPEECSRLESLYHGNISDLLDYGGVLELPKYMNICHYNNCYDGKHGVIVGINKQLISESLRGERPLPDMTPLLDWRKKHAIQTVEDIPRVLAMAYTE